MRVTENEGWVRVGSVVVGLGGWSDNKLGTNTYLRLHWHPQSHLGSIRCQLKYKSLFTSSMWGARLDIGSKPTPIKYKGEGSLTLGIGEKKLLQKKSGTSSKQWKNSLGGLQPLSSRGSHYIPTTLVLRFESWKLRFLIGTGSCLSPFLFSGLSL